MNAKFWMVLVSAAGVLASGIGAVAATTDQQTIRDMDAEWSRAAENKDAAKFASFYSETGSVMPFNALALADRWLPRPRVLHPYPADRFAASHPR